MVKLVAKKSKALPSAAHSLEEWHAQALQRYGGGHSTALLLTPHTAALRIQLRYRVYKEKVRSLIKKSSDRLKDDNSNGQASDSTASSVMGSVKAAVRERGVKGSSMALAVAYKVRKDPSEVEAPQQPLMVKNSKTVGAYAPPEVRSSIQDAPTTWGSSDWAVPSKGFVVRPHEQPEEEEDEKRDEQSEENGQAPRVASAEASVAVVAPTSQDEEEVSGSSSRESKFVDVMHPSWLLATIEERCAEAAASLGARGQYGVHRQLTILDVRHTVLDLLFILRSGMSENFHGRAPSSVSVHHKNLVRRLADGKDASASLDAETHRRVRRIFDSLKSDMVMPAVRCLGWMLTKTWRMLFNGLHVDVESLQRVREVIEASGNVSVVFTPTHKTHLDYLIVSYLCFAYGIPLPRIAAGNNLDLPVVGSFLRANGSFFIRRSFRNDQLYKQVLQHYVHELMSDGNPIEVFIEGGRSRHGRICKPKMGFLSMFSEYLQEEQQVSDGKDVVLVPISLDYDRVFEVEEYANQLLGKPKEKESLKVFFQSLWDLLFIRCGHCYVRFGEPVSMKAHESLTETAQELAVRMQTCGTVTSTAVVSALLMWKREYTMREMLLSRASWLVDELTMRGATIAHLQSVEELVDHALSVLDVDVKVNGVVESKVAFPTRALELGFYRNHLLHVFLPDMALLGAVESLRLRQEPSGSSVVTLDKTQVLETATWIWRFLRHICRHEDADLAQHLETLELRVPELSISDSTIQVKVSKWRVSRIAGFVLSLHWSFVDSLFLATLATWSLVDDDKHAPRAERDMLRLAQLLARELFMDKSITHAEAFCSESIKQAFEFLQETGTLSFSTCKESGVRMYQLGSVISVTDIIELQERVNALRKPKTFLYREDQPARAIACEEREKLVKRALEEGQTLAQRGRARGGVYATWMSH